MFAFARHSRRSAALASSAAAFVLLAGLAGSPGGGVPAAPPVHTAAAQLSPSGKIVDRFPDSAPASIRFPDRLASSARVAGAPQDRRAGLASFGIGGFAAVGAAAETPVAHIDAMPAEAAVPKPSRVGPRPQRPPLTVAVLPPRRPASLRGLEDVGAVASAAERHVSATARMIAFVGSLASLVRPL